MLFRSKRENVLSFLLYGIIGFSVLANPPLGKGVACFFLLPQSQRNFPSVGNFAKVAGLVQHCLLQRKSKENPNKNEVVPIRGPDQKEFIEAKRKKQYFD